jgi:hypothetical protein
LKASLTGAEKTTKHAGEKKNMQENENKIK